MKSQAGDPASLQHAFDAYVDRHGLLSVDGHLVVALSGGIDSMVLLDLVSSRTDRLVICHVNYGLRGEESELDEAFVREAAARVGAEVRVHREDPRHGTSSVQERARRIRYRFFAQVAEETGSAAVAVGHNLDDQAESILMSLFRGAGPRGLRGMQPRRRLRRDSPVMLIRPLLPFDRAEITAWAESRGLSWREDSSNLGTSYRRNALRHRLAPVLRDVFGHSAARRIARFGHLMAEYAELEDRLIAEAWSSSGGRAFLAVSDLDALPNALKGRAVLDALSAACPDCTPSHALAQRIIRLRNAQVGRRIVLGDSAIIRDRERLVFRGPVFPFEGARLPVPGSAEIPGGWIDATEWAREDIAWDTGSSTTACLDAAQLAGELEVRRWRRGDRIRPLGGFGSKKVSDVLTDARVDTSTRAERLVVLAGESIVWVPGVCVSDEFKVRPDTRRVVQLRMLGDRQGEPG